MAKQSDDQVRCRPCDENWAIHLCLATIGLIIFSTLYPFDFSWKLISETPLLSHFYWGFSGPGVGKEIVRNLVLFFPLGFSIAALLKRQVIGLWYSFILTGISLLVLSFFMELLQVFLPGRTATVSDVIAREIGSLLGACCFYLWSTKIFNFITFVIAWFRKKNSIRTLLYCCLGYLTLFITLSISLQVNTNLDNWDTDFPLVIGNETTGDRPWQGYVSEVAISAQPLPYETLDIIFQHQNFSTSELVSKFVAHYVLSDRYKTIYPDLTGNLPALQWHPKTPKPKENSEDQSNLPAVMLGPESWLKVDGVSLMTETLKQSSSLTLLTSLATSDLNQMGPARIISLSNGPYSRNLTLGQEGTDLIVRLRTTATGNNGVSPEIAISDFFSDLKFHKIAITYDQPTVHIYTETTNTRYSVHFTPDIIGFQYLLPLGTWKIRAGQTTLGYKVLYYSLALAPIALALLLSYAKRSRQKRFP